LVLLPPDMALSLTAFDEAMDLNGSTIMEFLLDSNSQWLAPILVTLLSILTLGISYVGFFF